MKDKLWVEKYRPQTLDQYVFSNDAQKKLIIEIFKSGNIPHLLLSGVQGTGKTTLAKILINNLELDESDILTLNASDENSVDVMRDKIKTFITTASFSEYKVIHLSEADYLTIPSQAILRSLLEEEYANVCRFIFTCNYVNKIIPAIKSRCQHIEFKQHDKNTLAELIVTILFNEKVACDLDTIDEFINAYSPDIRKIINEVQAHSSTGKLLSPMIRNDADFYPLLDSHIDNSNWKEAREVIAENVSSNEWESLYQHLYSRVNTYKCFDDQRHVEEALLLIAEYLYKHSIVSDPLINITALIIQLCTLRNRT